MSDVVTIPGYSLAPPAGTRFPPVPSFVSPTQIQLAYQLVAPPVPGPTAPALTPVAVATAANVSLPFLGAGILRPFLRDQKNDVANGAGSDLIRSCVGQVTGTRCANDGGTVQGELRWRPTFGAQLYLLKHAKGQALIELARIYLLDALIKWEPRVTNVRMTMVFDDSSLTLTVNLVYDIIRTNVAGNQVLVAGITQTLNLPIAA